MDTLFPMRRADLHMHTTCSDGAFDVGDVVKQAHAAGISIISVTDHDTVDAIPAAIQHATNLGMTCIPGIELTTRCNTVDVHLLGYFFDHTSVELHEYVDRVCLKRIERAERIVRRLNAIHVPLTMSDVMHRANGAAVGRPHIAGALIDRGFVPTYQKAFQMYLHDHGPAYEKIDSIPLEDAVHLLRKLGGIGVIAHPGILSEETLRMAIEAGVNGIEVVHPSHNPAKTDLFRSVASEFFLVQTGGSDFHGGVRNDTGNLGKYYIPEEYIDKMRTALQY